MFSLRQKYYIFIVKDVKYTEKPKKRKTSRHNLPIQRSQCKYIWYVFFQVSFLQIHMYIYFFFFFTYVYLINMTHTRHI